MQLVEEGIIHRDLKPANILVHQSRFKIAGKIQNLIDKTSDLQNVLRISIKI
jgi:serine/threonine protein kinase